MLNSIPKFLVEQGVKTIRARGFVRVHTEERLPDLLNGNVLSQHVVVLISDNQVQNIEISNSRVRVTGSEKVFKVLNDSVFNLVPLFNPNIIFIPDSINLGVLSTSNSS